MLVNNSGQTKLADFGLARFVPKKKPLTRRVVTLWYRAPELILGESSYSKAIDMWSAGCLLYELVTNGDNLFNGRDEITTIVKIYELCGPVTEENISGCGKLPNWEHFQPSTKEKKGVKFARCLREHLEKKRREGFHLL